METTQQFLKAVYNAIGNRRDSYVEMVMALASREQVESVVALSESSLYRRKFSSIYETLREVEIDEAALLRANLDVLGEHCEQLDGYEVPRVLVDKKEKERNPRVCEPKNFSQEKR